jgi:acetylornithine deacetylase
MIEHMQGRVPKASLAIIGEPTEWGIVTGHKGGGAYDIHVHGYEVHSSMPHTGVSAIMEGARLIDWANRTNEENRAKAAADSPYDPAWTTLHVGMIQGGTAHNITAKDCTFILSARCIPEEPVEHWLARMREEIPRVEAGMKAVRPETGITFEQRWDVPGLAAEHEGEAEALVRRLTGENGTTVVSYGTEAGPVPGGRLFRRGLRSGQHRPGPSTRRISYHRSTSEGRGLHGPAFSTRCMET